MGRFGAGGISISHRPRMGRVWAEPCPVGAPARRAPGLAFQEQADRRVLKPQRLWPGLPAQLFK